MGGGIKPTRKERGEWALNDRAAEILIVGMVAFQVLIIVMLLWL